MRIVRFQVMYLLRPTSDNKPAVDSARSLPIVPTTPAVCSRTGSLAGPLFLACTTSPLGPRAWLGASTSRRAGRLAGHACSTLEGFPRPTAVPPFLYHSACSCSCRVLLYGMFAHNSTLEITAKNDEYASENSRLLQLSNEYQSQQYPSFRLSVILILKRICNRVATVHPYCCSLR